MWDKWTGKDDPNRDYKMFEEAIGEFNDRRMYSRTGNYLKFLEDKYEMDKIKVEYNYRHLRNTAELQMLLCKDRYSILESSSNLSRRNILTPTIMRGLGPTSPYFKR